MIIERNFLNHLIINPEILEKTSLKYTDFDDSIVKNIFRFIMSKYSETQEYSFMSYSVISEFYDKYEKNLKELTDDDGFTYKDLHEYLSFEYTNPFDWLYSEQVIKTISIKREHKNLLTKALEDLDDNETDTVISSLDISLRNLEKEMPNEDVLIKASSYHGLYDEETKRIEEDLTLGKLPYYTFADSIIKEHVRMVRGSYFTIIAASGVGKTIKLVHETIEFAKAYNERCLFITDENSYEVILAYMHCNYLGLKYKDVEDRKINLTAYINSLSEKEKATFDKVFSLIDVVEIAGIPNEEVRKLLKRAKIHGNPYTLVSIDSFDEMNLGVSTDENTRYDLNAKSVERLAKEFDCIVGVSAQLKTDYYEISVEKMPMMCNHQSKTLVKKSRFAWLLQWEFKKSEDDVENLGLRSRILKSRSGGKDSIQIIDCKYDYCRMSGVGSALNQVKKDDIGF
jgi:KaiC/GvpD/RAD55 family RecA-like ATPase